jgi:hypothetical protein
LKAADAARCPAAVEILPVVRAFQTEDAYQKVSVVVQDDRRTYSKSTTLEEALRSLLGLKMATSGCPVLSELKPMAIHHLPFANNEEFILRSVSHFLLQQYLAKRNDEEPDWELKGLVAQKPASATGQSGALAAHKCRLRGRQQPQSLAELLLNGFQCQLLTGKSVAETGSQNERRWLVLTARPYSHGLLLNSLCEVREHHMQPHEEPHWLWSPEAAGSPYGRGCRQ